MLRLKLLTNNIWSMVRFHFWILMLFFWLVHTRDVDKTITNILEGRVHYDPAPPQVSDYSLLHWYCSLCCRDQPYLQILLAVAWNIYHSLRGKLHSLKKLEGYWTCSNDDYNCFQYAGGTFANMDSNNCVNVLWCVMYMARNYYHLQFWLLALKCFVDGQTCVTMLHATNHFSIHLKNFKSCLLP